MSFRATTWAIEVCEQNKVHLTGPEAATLYGLAWCHNHMTGQCNPGPETLAKRCKLGISTVRKALASLCRKLGIDRVSWGRSWAYRLPIPDHIRPAPAD